MASCNLDDLCRYWDPYCDNENSSCRRGSNCFKTHLSLNDFEFQLRTMKKSKLKKLGEIYIANRNFACGNAALSALLNVSNLQKRNDFGRILCAFAQSCEGINDNNTANEYYEKSLQVDPNDPRTNSHFAQFLHNKGNVQCRQQSNDYFVKSLKLDPNNGHTHQHYAKLLNDEGQIDEAVRHFLMCLELIPMKKECLFDLAMLYHYKKADLKQSQHYFDQFMSAIKYSQQIDQDYYSEHLEYGLLLKKLKKPDEAFSEFKKSLKYSHHSRIRKGRVYFEIGFYYENKQNMQNAKDNYRHASDCNPQKFSVFFQEFLAHNFANEKKENNELNPKPHHINQNIANKVQQILHKSHTNTTPMNDSNKHPNANTKTNEKMYSFQTQSETHENNTKTLENTLNEWGDLKEQMNKFENTKQEQKLQSNSQSASQKEFYWFLNQMSFVQMYYDKFKENHVDSMQYLTIFNEDLLKNEIHITNPLHIRFFMRQIDAFNNDKVKFESWLNDIELLDDYGSILGEFGIFTMKSFNRNIKSKQDLARILGEHNEFDIGFMWKSTPKQKRKNEKHIQREGFESEYKEN